MITHRCKGKYREEIRVMPGKSMVYAVTVCQWQDYLKNLSFKGMLLLNQQLESSGGFCCCCIKN